MANEHRVFVVVDPEYGERTRELSRGRQVWIVRSTLNDPAIESVRANCVADPLESSVTAFVASETAEGSLLSILYDVELHHGEHSHDPPLTAIKVVGTGATETVREHLAEYGFRRIEPDGEGFTAFRE